MAYSVNQGRAENTVFADLPAEKIIEAVIFGGLGLTLIVLFVLLFALREQIRYGSDHMPRKYRGR